MGKQMIFGSMGVAAVVAALTLLDLATGFPFARSLLLDILFLVSAGIVAYLGYDALQDMA